MTLESPVSEQSSISHRKFPAPPDAGELAAATGAAAAHEADIENNQAQAERAWNELVALFKRSVA